eukprot:2969644-Pleurochrysis_carterae.AAC.6
MFSSCYTLQIAAAGSAWTMVFTYQVQTDNERRSSNSQLVKLKASDALQVGPPRPFWHLEAPERAVPQGSGAGRHSPYGRAHRSSLSLPQRMPTVKIVREGKETVKTTFATPEGTAHIREDCLRFVQEHTLWSFAPRSPVRVFRARNFDYSLRVET